MDTVIYKYTIKTILIPLINILTEMLCFKKKNRNTYSGGGFS